MRPNQKTRQVHVLTVALGDGAPVVVQSMLNARPMTRKPTLRRSM